MHTYIFIYIDTRTYSFIHTHTHTQSTDAALRPTLLGSPGAARSHAGGVFLDAPPVAKYSQPEIDTSEIQVSICERHSETQVQVPAPRRVSFHRSRYAQSPY